FQRRHPERHPELARKPGVALAAHETGVDQNAAALALQQHEGERQVHHAVVVHARHEVDPGLVFRARVFEDIDVPIRRLSHVSPLQLSASVRPRLESPTATIRIAPWNTYWEKVG